MPLDSKLKLARSSLGKTQKEMADTLGISKRGWQTYEEGRNTPGGKIFEKLSELGFNVSWFFNDDVPMMLDEKPGYSITTTSPDQDDEYVRIPHYDVAASAGGGAVVDGEQVVDYLSFRSDWVIHSLGLSVKDLALISVIGDSMEPTLSDGDVVLLDMTTRNVLDGSIYALQVNEGLIVKRVQRKLDGSLVIKPDNPHYDEEVVTENNQDMLNIIGRVVWAGRKL